MGSAKLGSPAGPIIRGDLRTSEARHGHHVSRDSIGCTQFWGSSGPAPCQFCQSAMAVRNRLDLVVVCPYEVCLYHGTVKRSEVRSGREKNKKYPAALAGWEYFPPSGGMDARWQMPCEQAVNPSLVVPCTDHLLRGCSLFQGIPACKEDRGLSTPGDDLSGLPREGRAHPDPASQHSACSGLGPPAIARVAACYVVGCVATGIRVTTSTPWLVCAEDAGQCLSSFVCPSIDRLEANVRACPSDPEILHPRATGTLLDSAFHHPHQEGSGRCVICSPAGLSLTNI